MGAGASVTLKLRWGSTRKVLKLLQSELLDVDFELLLELSRERDCLYLGVGVGSGFGLGSELGLRLKFELYSEI